MPFPNTENPFRGKRPFPLFSHTPDFFSFELGFFFKFELGINFHFEIGENGCIGNGADLRYLLYIEQKRWLHAILHRIVQKGSNPKHFSLPR